MGSYAFGAVAPTSSPPRLNTPVVTPRDTGYTGTNGFKASLPDNTCGYGDFEYDTSYTTLSVDDTVWVSYSTAPSNCAAQESDLGCASEMKLTGPGSVLGSTPYIVWYYFDKIGDGLPFVKLYFNYNNSATHLVASVSCDIDQYTVSLTKCMFNRDWLVYKFFTRYIFSFYMTCHYDSDLNTVDFNLDQSIKTYNGDLNQDGVCNEVNNRFNLASFQAWQLSIGMISVEIESELCVDNPPSPTPPQVTPSPPVDITTTAVVTTTEVATTTSIDNGNGGTVVINIRN